MTNVIVASFYSGHSCYAPAIWQWDKGIVLKIDGVELPANYEIHFSNIPDVGTAERYMATSEGVEIPHKYIVPGQNIYAWVYVVLDESTARTECMITIPVQGRPEPIPADPTPAEQDIIEEAIAALNAGVEAVEAAEEMMGNPTTETETLPPGSDATSNYANGVFSFGIPTGQQGPKGDEGQPGPKGESGVYYGTDEPTDPDINVWIDPEGTGDNALIPPGGTTNQIIRKRSNAMYDAAWSDQTPTVNVSGMTPTITGVAETQYVCGEVVTITITPPAVGCIDVIFESGSTPAVLIVPNGVRWARGFNPTDLKANTVYEINILNGVYGVVETWE